MTYYWTIPLALTVLVWGGQFVWNQAPRGWADLPGLDPIIRLVTAVVCTMFVWLVYFITLAMFA